MRGVSCVACAKGVQFVCGTVCTTYQSLQTLCTGGAWSQWKCAVIACFAPDLDACVAAVSYGYPWAQAIKALKFQEDPGWAATLATLLHRAPAAQVAIAQADEVLCVPLSAAASRTGFNQSALIAHALAQKSQPHALLRLHDTAAQSGLNRSQRLNNLRNAFMVEPNISSQLNGQAGDRGGRCDDHGRHAELP